LQIIPFDLQSPRNFSICPVDYLFHLAWNDLPKYNATSQLGQVNAHVNFIRQNFEKGTGKIIKPGTEQEYGDKDGVISENHLLKPSSFYGEAKTQVLNEIIRTAPKDCNLVWGRLFYMFGRNQPDYTFYGSLQKAILNKQPEFFVKFPHFLADYSRVEDIAIKIKELTLNHKSNGVYNIASGTPILLGDLVESWIKESKSAIKIKTTAERTQISAFWADVSKVMAVLHG
jgi:dTDP-6-deoxy-L-talose 4-dehydrogenase (NAD+)